jgi:hypothetical protein
LGVDAKAGFVLTTSQPLNAGQVKAALAPSPVVALNVEEKSAREFKITPAQDLPQDSLLKFVFRSPDSGAVLGSWAYQVQAPLRIVSTIPADQRTFVPIDTGIELTFSSDEVLNPQAGFSISPPVQGRFEQHKRTLVFVPQSLQAGTLYTVTLKPGVKVNGSDATLEEPFVLQFETAAERRGGPPPPTLSFLRAVHEAGTAEPPVIAVNTTDVNLKTLSLAVYAYPDQKTYVSDLAKLDSIPSWSSLARDGIAVDPARLKLAMTVNVAVEDVLPPGPASGFSQPFIPCRRSCRPVCTCCRPAIRARRYRPGCM